MKRKMVKVKKDTSMWDNASVEKMLKAGMCPECGLYSRAKEEVHTSKCSKCPPTLTKRRGKWVRWIKK